DRYGEQMRRWRAYAHKTSSRCFHARQWFKRADCVVALDWLPNPPPGRGSRDQYLDLVRTADARLQLHVGQQCRTPRSNSYFTAASDCDLRSLRLQLHATTNGIAKIWIIIVWFLVSPGTIFWRRCWHSFGSDSSPVGLLVIINRQCTFAAASAARN